MPHLMPVYPTQLWSIIIKAFHPVPALTNPVIAVLLVPVSAAGCVPLLPSCKVNIEAALCTITTFDLCPQDSTTCFIQDMAELCYKLNEGLHDLASLSVRFAEDHAAWVVHLE